jgi:Leucine-rich repeat (LRR) protein
MKKLSLIFLALFTSLYGKSQVIEQDSLALVSFYNSMNGINWYDNSNWLTASVGNWYGITISNNRVVKIKLGPNNLVGAVPQEFGNLDSLSVLTLAGNSIYSFPSTIGNLSTLDTLALFVSNFDTLPPAIGGLQDLKFLDLRLTQIRYLPDEIGSLSKLEYLLVYYTDLRKIPESIGGLTSLKVLDLGLNSINNFPSSIGNCTQLTNLSLNANQIPNVPAEIGNLTNLVQLILGGNNIDSLPPELFNLTNLRVLNFASNNIHDIPASIGNLVDLENFQFFNNNITSIPPEIGNLTELYYINGYSNKINELPLSLLSLPNLETLFLPNNSLTFDGIEPLVNINGFEYWQQDSIGQNIDTIVSLNTPFQLECITGGQYNIYQWFKDGDSIPGANSSFIDFPALTYTESGTYHCAVTNSLATGLTLYARPIHLNVTDPSGFSNDIFNEAVLSVYPNPARGIAVIRSNNHCNFIETEVLITNIWGVRLHSLSSNHYDHISFDCSDLDPGIYFIQLIDKQSGMLSKAKKLIVRE